MAHVAIDDERSGRDHVPTLLRDNDASDDEAMSPLLEDSDASADEAMTTSTPPLVWPTTPGERETTPREGLYGLARMFAAHPEYVPNVDGDPDSVHLHLDAQPLITGNRIEELVSARDAQPLLQGLRTEVWLSAL